jgi:hypothetical protein
MKKLLCLLVVLVAAMAMFTTGASAVRNGQPDNGRHP